MNFFRTGNQKKNKQDETYKEVLVELDGRQDKTYEKIYDRTMKELIELYLFYIVTSSSGIKISLNKNFCIFYFG